MDQQLAMQVSHLKEGRCETRVKAPQAKILDLQSINSERNSFKVPEKAANRRKSISHRLIDNDEERRR